MVTYVSQGKFVCAFEELLLSFLESWKVIKHAVSLKGKKKQNRYKSQRAFSHKSFKEILEPKLPHLEFLKIPV